MFSNFPNHSSQSSFPRAQSSRSCSLLVYHFLVLKNRNIIMVKVRMRFWRDLISALLQWNDSTQVILYHGFLHAILNTTSRVFSIIMCVLEVLHSINITFCGC